MDGEVNDSKDVTHENKVADINNVGAKMEQITVNGSDAGADWRLHTPDSQDEVRDGISNNLVNADFGQKHFKLDAQGI